ncbi:MAG: hypothetical protein AAF511_04910 [Pseudomonadota bacterium]
MEEFEGEGQLLNSDRKTQSIKTLKDVIYSSGGYAANSPINSPTDFPGSAFFFRPCATNDINNPVLSIDGGKSRPLHTTAGKLMAGKLWTCAVKTRDIAPSMRHDTRPFGWKDRPQTIKDFGADLSLRSDSTNDRAAGLFIAGHGAR